MGILDKIKKIGIGSTPLVISLHAIGTIAQFVGLSQYIPLPTFEMLVDGGVIIPLIAWIIAVSGAVALADWIKSLIGKKRF